MPDQRPEALREAHELLGKMYAHLQRGEVRYVENLGGGIWTLPDRIGAWLEAQDAARAAGVTGTLPPLPEAKVMVRETDEEVRSLENGGWIVDCDCEGPLSYSLEAGEALYTADQMREYALAAAGVRASDGQTQDAQG